MFPVNLNQNSEPGVVNAKASIVSGSDNTGKREHVLRDLLQVDLITNDSGEIKALMPVGGSDDKPIAMADFFEPSHLQLTSQTSDIALNLRSLIFNNADIQRHGVFVRRKLCQEYHNLFADEEAYTEWGKTFRDLIKGKDFIDFCSQNPNINFFPGLVADKFGAKSYTAIDTTPLMPNEFKAASSNSCPHISIKSCILSFIKKMKPGINNRVFFFSGAESTASTWNRVALNELRQKLGEVSKKGDVLIFDSTSADLIFDLTKSGFEFKSKGNFMNDLSFFVYEKTE